MRGRLLSILREAPGPVPPEALDRVCDDEEQRERALAGLLADRLLDRRADGRYELPTGLSAAAQPER